MPPALPPFCELLCVGLFNTSPLMKAVHQIITQSVAIVYPFHCSLVVTNLRTSNRYTEKHRKTAKDIEKRSHIVVVGRLKLDFLQVVAPWADSFNIKDVPLHSRIIVLHLYCSRKSLYLLDLFYVATKMLI